VPVRRTLVALAVVAVLAGCRSGPDRAEPPGPGTGSGGTGPEVVAETDGATLTRHRMPGGGLGFLQRIDVRKMRVEQILGDRDGSRPAAPGLYHPAADSPYYGRVPASRMQDSCRGRFGAAAFSAVNFSFFEEYEASTRLSFPIQVDGVVRSGGSSPYGPVAAPKDEYYRTVTLRALTWTGQQAAVAPYDHATGAPLTAPGARDAVVSYAYADHPSYALGKDPANRYQLLGVLDADGRDGAEYLLILTLDEATLAAGADLLRSQGVGGDVMTFDGGVSTYLWSGAGGDLVTPTSRDGALPHYLCVHRPA
jgi:hypothetical protein